MGGMGGQSFQKQREQREEEKAAAKAASGVKTSIRTRQVVPERIKSRGPRSGVEVTRPAENQFITGPNVTGVNELEDLI